MDWSLVTGLAAMCGVIVNFIRIGRWQGNIESRVSGLEKTYDNHDLRMENLTRLLSKQNEAIRQTRESLYRATSDYLKADYDEAVARGANNVEELKQKWLESKDKIREENPYIGGDKDGLQGEEKEITNVDI